ncbi:hypothetical protein NM688_g8575 [Phlebia brevispora]|uniref:Uncharacterized protein n=1 Tax=Phlebia brevispora TaxID=194682 RepID=A0ACC1RRW8_9APHY|nr:hypothetical protein NM688_g8575 [Phlebia brevispora]
MPSITSVHTPSPAHALATAVPQIVLEYPPDSSFPDMLFPRMMHRITSKCRFHETPTFHALAHFLFTDLSLSSNEQTGFPRSLASLRGIWDTSYAAVTSVNYVDNSSHFQGFNPLMRYFSWAGDVTPIALLALGYRVFIQRTSRRHECFPEDASLTRSLQDPTSAPGKLFIGHSASTQCQKPDGLPS